MRLLLFAAVLAAPLFAQTVENPSLQELMQLPITPHLQQQAMILPRITPEALNFVVERPQTCSIGLTNVMRSVRQAPVAIPIVPSPNPMPIRQVNLPAPPCDDKQQ